MIRRLLLAALFLSPPAFGQLTYGDLTGAIDNLGWDSGRAELELADINGDGHVDVVTVGDHGSPFINTQMHGVTAWLGDGQGGWTLVQTGDFGYGGLALGDVNGDGLVDVGYGVHHDYSDDDLGDQLLEVALGDGSGTAWTPWDDGLATAGEDWGMFACDFGDIDSDGDLDVGSISFGCCSGVQVYRNDGDGSWTHSFGFLGGNSDETFRFADFDGDGHLDIAAGHQDTSVLRGLGDGSFTAATGNLPSAWLGIGAGDVDGDGRDELSFVGAGGALEVWTWTAGDVWVDMSGTLPTSGNWSATELCDMDGDGDADLAAYEEGRIFVVAWEPGDVWSVIGQATVPGSPGAAAAFRAGVDVDHNGLPDFAVLQPEGGGPFSSGQNHLYVMGESSTPSALAAGVVSPSANRRWIGGQARFVDWSCAVPAGDVATIDLELSADGPSGPWSSLASNLANDGRHQLVVPTQIHSSTCHVRITATTAGDQVQAVSAAFSIDAPAQVAAHGCGVNPTGSLTIDGVPVPGALLTVAIDDPPGSSPNPSAALLLGAVQPDPSFPCGTSLPGFGMSGPVGELLIGLTAPDPVLVLPLAAPWTTPGVPVTTPLPIPGEASLLGLSLYLQGALAGAGSTKLTEGRRLTIGV